MTVRGFAALDMMRVCPGARKNDIPLREQKPHCAGTVEALREWARLIAAKQPADIRSLLTPRLQSIVRTDIGDTDDSAVNAATDILSPLLVDDNVEIGFDEDVNLKVDEWEIADRYRFILIAAGTAVVGLPAQFDMVPFGASPEAPQFQGWATAILRAFDHVERVQLWFLDSDTPALLEYERANLDDLAAAITETLRATERPFRTLEAGEHCAHCRWATECPAAMGPLKTLVTEISPMVVPSSFDPTKQKTARDWALLRHWAAVCDAAMKAIRREALAYVKAHDNKPLRCVANGQEVIRYELSHYNNPLRMVEADKVWPVVKKWMPVENFLRACHPLLGKLQKEMLTVMEERIVAAGRTPNRKRMKRDFAEMLTKRKLFVDESEEPECLMPSYRFRFGRNAAKDD